MIKIDGSYGSGGGQILRTAASLSAITKKPIHVFNIRKGRPKGGGLKTQHLLGLQALSRLCNGRLEGDSLDSQEIKFYPNEIREKDLRIKIDTAGSISLLLQTLVPVGLFTPKPVKIIFDGGGTDTFFSPSFDYFQYVFLKLLTKMGLKYPEINLKQRGYYPAGGAEVEITVYPSELKKINLTKRGALEKIQVFSGASEFLRSKKVAERQLAGVREILGKLKLPTEERVEYYQTACPGSHICLVAQFENTVLGTDNLGKLGKPAETIGKEAALELLKQEKAKTCLDKHMADQILLFMALASRKSQVTVSEITNHCKTNIWVIEKFTQHRNEISGAGFLDGKFEIEDNLISWNPNTLNKGDGNI